LRVIPGCYAGRAELDQPASTRPLSPQPLATQLREVAATWSASQHQLVVLTAEFADSAEWVLDGSPTRRLSYSKVRTLTRIATVDNEAELVAIAEHVPASQLGQELARWLNNNTTPEDIDDLHRRQRSIKWRTEPDGIVTFTLRLPPLLAGTLIAMLTTLVMRPSRCPDASAHLHPTLAQQHVDALETILTNGAGTITTLDDGTPSPAPSSKQSPPMLFSGR
jgi:hypothetical protein